MAKRTKRKRGDDDKWLHGIASALLVNHLVQHNDSHNISRGAESVSKDPHQCTHPEEMRVEIDTAMRSGRHPATISKKFKRGYPNCSKQIRYEAGECTFACRHCYHNGTFWDFDVSTFYLRKMKVAAKTAFMKKWGGKSFDE